MKFIHTSDWHIGRQFHNVSLLEDQQHVLTQLLDYIKQEAVDVLVIAGDVYDRSIPPAAAVELLDKLLNKICI
jgi:exonuclease SbcD